MDINKIHAILKAIINDTTKNNYTLTRIILKLFIKIQLKMKTTMF